MTGSTLSGCGCGPRKAPVTDNSHREKQPKRAWLRTCERSAATKFSQEAYPFIHRGFIVPGFRLAHGVATLWEETNERTNVITQLIGLIIFVWMLVRVRTLDSEALRGSSDAHRSILSLTSENVEQRRVWFEAMLFADCLTCTFSLIYHMLGAQGRTVHNILATFDWLGAIISVCVGAVAIDAIDEAPGDIAHGYLPWFLPPLLHAGLTIGYFVSLLAIFVCCNTTHGFRFLSIFFGSIVATFPSAMGIIAVAPSRTLAGVLGFAIGGFFFSTFLPERVFPRTFDIWLSSHTLWHIGYIGGLVAVRMGCACLLFGHDEFLEFW